MVDYKLDFFFFFKLEFFSRLFTLTAAILPQSIVTICFSDHVRVKSFTRCVTHHMTMKTTCPRFKFGPISEIIYIAAGSSVDWAYENAGIK